MPSYDEKTPRGWPLPFKSNTLEFDVERLRDTFLKIDEGLGHIEDKARVLVNETIAGVEERQYILDARMDVIAGQTTEDSEILDARVDAKGTMHPNLGHNVRTVHSNLLELNDNVLYGISEFRGLLRQFNELAYAQIQGELNTKEAHERRKAELAQETQARIESDGELHDELARETQTREEQTASLQAQTQELSEASLTQSVNLTREAEQRRRDIQETHSLINAESEERAREDAAIRAQTVQGLSDVNEALGEETTSRKHADDALHADIQVLQSQDEALQAQAADLAQASLNNALNLRETAERGRDALKQEALTRAEDDGVQQVQIDTLAEGDIRQTLNLHYLNEKHKADISSEATARIEGDEALQVEANELASASLQHSLNLHVESEERRNVAENLTAETQTRAEDDEALRQGLGELQQSLSYEEYARHSDDTAQQGQIDSLTEASLQQSLNLYKEIVAREEAEAARVEEDTHLQTEIDNLTEATLRGAINLSEETASRKSADIQEAQARTVQGELLQAQIDNLSNASIRQDLNASHEAQTRREGLTRVDTQLDALQKQTANHQDAIANLIEAMLRSSINLHEALDRRREALTREANARAENDDLLQAQTQELSEASLQHSLSIQREVEHRRELLRFADEQLAVNDYLQKQIDDLTAGALQAAENLHEALERGREALHQEAQTRSEHEDILQGEISDNTQAILQQSLIIVRESEKRRELEQVVAGIKSPVDWSKAESLAIPEPHCAVVNFTGLKSMPTSKTVEIPAYMEFWDMQGNYFKKPIVCSAQGSSSLGYVKKNVKFDLLNDDGEEFDLKIGNWVVQDGFHLKAYYTDFFRGVGVTSYKLWDEIMETRPCKKALVDVEGMNPTANGEGNVSDLTLQFDTGALCHPDGFPCLVYLNGEFYGVYSWQIKKQRKNYHMDKSTVEHIHLDGTLSTANFWNGTINWAAFEIRNPNKLYTMDGKKYDGDAPRELIDETSPNYKPGNKDHVRSATVKRYIQSLVQRFGELKQIYSTYRVSDPDRVKAAYEELFDWENMRDYLIFSDVIKNSDGYAKNWQWTTYDGVRWYVNAYDLDMSFGGHWQGIQITAPLTGHITTSTALPVYYVALLYKAELEARYRKLRDEGIIDVEHIVSKLADWTARIGEKNYKLEYKRWPNSPCILNYRDSVDRVRKWLTVEIANMDKVYHYTTEVIATDEPLRREASAREAADDWEAYLRASETSALQIQVNDLARVSLEDRFRFLALIADRKTEMQQETQERSESDQSLQGQINDLAFAVIKVALNDKEARERLSEFVGRLYQAVADTGNLTYKGAGVASSREIREMLNDVLTGTESETTASEIPEELRDQVATSSEINEMLDEIIPNRS